MKNSQTAMNMKTEKNKKPICKITQTAKTKIPMQMKENKRF